MHTSNELEEARLAAIIAEGTAASAESSVNTKIEAIRVNMVKQMDAVRDEANALRSEAVKVRKEYEECLHCCVRDGIER